MAAPPEFLQAVLGYLYDEAQESSIALIDALKAYRKKSLGGGMLLGHPETSASGGGFSTSRMVPSMRSATEAAESAAFLINLHAEVSTALTSASIALTDARIHTEMQDRLTPCKVATADFSRILDASPVITPVAQGYWTA